MIVRRLRTPTGPANAEAGQLDLHLPIPAPCEVTSHVCTPRTHPHVGKDLGPLQQRQLGVIQGLQQPLHHLVHVVLIACQHPPFWTKHASNFELCIEQGSPDIL